MLRQDRWCFHCGWGSEEPVRQSKDSQRGWLFLTAALLGFGNGVRVDWQFGYFLWTGLYVLFVVLSLCAGIAYLVISRMRNLH
jgi:hypothetical protein